jgi:hypothetical protein
MLIIAALISLALPLILAMTYALLWPTVPSRVGLFITVGSLSGILLAAATLFWVAQPLVGIGISGIRPGQPSTPLGSLLGSRVLAGILTEAVGVCLILLLLGRWWRSS